jgi:hypothetical protein
MTESSSSRRERPSDERPHDQRDDEVLPRGYEDHAIAPIPGGEDEPPPPRHGLDRRLAEGREQAARTRVEAPDAEPLEQPFRTYHPWTGPLRSAVAFRQHPHEPPSLVWPEDRSWFIGAPIYTNEIAIGATEHVIDAVLAAPGLYARRAACDDVLDIDD